MAISRAPNPTPPNPIPLPDPLAPALRRRLQQCYEHATKLMATEKYDFDYAHTMLAECIIHDPSNLVYVETFLTNLIRKYDNNKKGARFGGASKGAFKKAAAKQEWKEVLKLGPEILKTNPWEIQTLRSMADACAALDYREVELRYLKNALDADPKAPEVNRHCAKSLARMGQFDQAMACWHRVEEALKNDEEAPRMIGQLQVEKTRASAGFGDPAAGTGKPGATTPGKTPAPIAAQQPSAAEPAKKREVQLTPRQMLERAIAGNPEDLENYLELAQIHINENRPADAEQLLTKALGASGNDLRVRERLEDVGVLKLKQKITVAERLAATNKTPESQELVTQLRSDLNRMEVGIFNSRSQRYPQDHGLKYQLAVRLKRAGNVAEALKQFQESTTSAEHKGLATLEMGECQQMLKQYNAALNTYRQAAILLSEPNQLEARKLALYRAGVLATGLKNMDVAETLLTELLQLDPKYKDTADRLDKIRQIRDKG